MTANRKYDHHRLTLLDHNGPWCAWCLLNIDDNEPLEIHHVLPTEAVKKLLPWDFALPWFVPSHHDCHRQQLQILSGGLTEFLQRVLAEPPERLANLNERLHNSSHYWFPVLTYAQQRVKSLDPEEKTMAYMFSSASGIRMGRRLLKKLLGSFDFPQEPRELINLSNLEFSSGSIQRARQLLELAKVKVPSLRGANRDDTKASFLRRAAQLQLDLEAASEAQALSESNLYTVRTAVLQKGWINYTKGQINKAFNHFESLEERSNPTWLYRAEVLFAHALCSISFHQIDEQVYACLIAAQYLLAMPGLVGPSSRFLWYNRGANFKGKTPAEILLRTEELRRFRKEQCFQIRRAAIFGSGRSKLLKTVLGDHNLRDTLFDDLRIALAAELRTAAS